MTHEVFWYYKAGMDEKQREEAANLIREKLEGLVGKIDGLLTMKVILSYKETSSRDIGLISTFTSMDALLGYQCHPLHEDVSTYIRSVTSDRICFDYE